MAEERKQKFEQAEQVREMETRIETLESQNRKLRKDFRKSILMLEQLKKKHARKGREWKVESVISLSHVHQKKGEGKVAPKQVKTKRRKRKMVARRGSSLEKYKQSILAENLENSGNSDHEKMTVKDQKWGEIRCELEKCRGLLRATNSEICRSVYEDKENSIDGRNKLSRKSPGKRENKAELKIGSLGNYQYRKSVKAELEDAETKNPNEESSKAYLPKLEVESISDNELLDIFSMKQKQKTGYQKKGNPCYDDGLFEYLQQTGELTFN